MLRRGGLVILGICMTTKMFFTLSRWVHEIALEKSKLELLSATHNSSASDCSNVESLGILEHDLYSQK